jgi:hypothetical protein
VKKRLYDVLSVCETEEEVKSEFAKYFKFKIKTKQRFDHYSTQILYEFKYDKNLKNVPVRARIIAQTMYYIRELKFGSGTKPIPPFICIVDKNETFIFETKKFKDFYSDTRRTKYDWDRAPSIPCPVLVKEISEYPFTASIHVYTLESEEDENNFIKKHAEAREVQARLFEDDKKVITEDNFLEIYNYWKELFGKYVENSRKASEYFAADIETGKTSIYGESEVVFRLGDGGDAKIKSIPINDYKYFWNIYNKIDDLKVIYGIRQKIDRISEDYERRFTGEFYTPINFAKKGLEYIERTIGAEWWKKDDWRFWDMAAGTGNLEFTLPTSALDKCYISTLLEDDANYCKRIFPTATVFQYDYLNDDLFTLVSEDRSLGAVNQKMPKKLQDDLANPNIKWIIFINPPFATSNTVGGETGKKSKDTVSMTGTRQLMEKENLGETSRELFAQFLYRIHKEFDGKNAYLGLFSKLKYINSNNDQKLRDQVFRHKFERGFMFSSESFYGSKGKFPVGFLVWNLKKNQPIEEQEINLDVYNTDLGKYGTKIIQNENRERFLSKWVDRPECNIIMPPFKSAITIGLENVDTRNRVAEGFLCSLMCKGNDFLNQNMTALLSGPYISAGAYSVTPDNFEKSMIIHAVRRLPKANWTNDRDQFYQPLKDPLPNDFVADCVIWSIFSDSNNVVSLKDIEYLGKIYQIHNNLYPYPLKEVKDWKHGLSSLGLQAISTNEDKFVSKWINEHQLSQESQDVYDAGRLLYIAFYQNVNKTRWLDYKIELWDVGLWQIRMALNGSGLCENEMNGLKTAHNKLGKKLLPQLYEFGFIPKDVVKIDSAEENLDQT